jgi:hypothetical protein
MASHLSATGQVLIDQRIRRHFSVRAGKGLGATAISRSSNRLLPNRCYRSELLCEAPNPAVLNGALSHSRECRNLTLLSPCVATRQPRPALTFRAELGICGTASKRHGRNRIAQRGFPLRCRVSPRTPLTCTPALGRNPRTNAPLFILAAHRLRPRRRLRTFTSRVLPSRTDLLGLPAAWITVLPRSVSLATTKPALDGR